MKLGAYTACLHDRPLREALEVLKGMNLTGAETGSFRCRVRAGQEADGAVWMAGVMSQGAGDVGVAGEAEHADHQVA